MYNKLFVKILDSSIWLEPTTTRIVWITLLAAMDRDGYAHFSAMENLASRARVTLQECESAIEVLEAPDKNSGDPEYEGRRVERVPGGFMILNAPKYRDVLNKTLLREQTRLRVAKHRAKKVVTKSVTRALPTVTGRISNVTVTPVTPSDTDTDADTEEEDLSLSGGVGGDKVGRSNWPSSEEVKVYGEIVGCPPEECGKFFDHFEGTGWRDKHGNPVADWRAKLRSWKTYSQAELGRTPKPAQLLTRAEREAENKRNLAALDEKIKQQQAKKTVQ